MKNTTKKNKRKEIEIYSKSVYTRLNTKLLYDENILYALEWITTNTFRRNPYESKR